MGDKKYGGLVNGILDFPPTEQAVGISTSFYCALSGQADIKSPTTHLAVWRVNSLYRQTQVSVRMIPLERSLFKIPSSLDLAGGECGVSRVMMRPAFSNTRGNMLDFRQIVLGFRQVEVVPRTDYTVGFGRGSRDGFWGELKSRIWEILTLRVKNPYSESKDSKRTSKCVFGVDLERESGRWIQGRI